MSGVELKRVNQEPEDMKSVYEELVKELQSKVENLKKKKLSKTLKNLQFHSK